MKTHIFTKNFFFAVLTGTVLALSVTGCSDDDTEKTQPAKVAHNPFDHSHDAEVTDIQKHKFEHDFADQCVQRELKNSVNPDIDKERFAKSCLCIAAYMMKDLTAKEAEKFLTEHESPRSLEIKFDSAAYHCLQEKTPPKDHAFTRQQ